MRVRDFTPRVVVCIPEGCNIYGAGGLYTMTNPTTMHIVRYCSGQHSLQLMSAVRACALWLIRQSNSCTQPLACILGSTFVLRVTWPLLAPAPCYAASSKGLPPHLIARGSHQYYDISVSNEPPYQRL